MKKFNDNTVIATGKEMDESGLFPHPANDSTELILWIKWHWDPNSKKDSFAPVSSIYPIKKDATHQVVGEELFLHLHKRENGFPFEHFINQHLPITQL